jgi:diguanylate cyclase (GGDEF)-like protein
MTYMDFSSTILDLKKKLSRTGNSLDRLRLKVSLARYTHYEDRKESLRLVEELESEVQRVQDEFVHGWYWYNRGWHSYEEGEILRSLEEFQKSHEYFLLINDESGLEGKAASMGGQANCYYGLGDYNNALPIMLETLELADKGGDRRLSGATSQNIGAIYINFRKFDLARSFLERAYKIFQDIEENHTLAPIFLNMAVTYREEGKYSVAHSWFEKVYALETIGGSPHFHCECLIEQGQCYFLEKEFEKADACLVKGRDIASTHGFSALLKALDLLCCRIKSETGHLDEALKIIEFKKDEKRGEPQLERLLLLSELTEKKGDFKKALEYHKEYHKEFQRQEGEGKSALFTDTRIKLAEESNKRMQVISDIGKKITANLNLEQISLSIFESLSELMGADVFGIGLLGGEGLTYPPFQLKNEIKPGFTIPLNAESSFGLWAIKNNRTIIINDLERESENYVVGLFTHEEYKPQKNKKVESLIYVPLVYNENPIGVLTVQSYKKGNFSLSHINILEALESFVAIAVENSRKTEELERLSGIDFLTGIANRRRLDEHYREISQICRRSKSPLSLLLLDIDYFKRFNDDHGHDTGDSCLKHLAQVITDSLHRPLDRIGRLGGEEFLIILGNTSEDEGVLIAEKLRRTIEESPLIEGDKSLPITVSIGGVTFHSGEPEGLVDSPWLKKADSAMYAAKDGGRNRVSWSKA